MLLPDVFLVKKINLFYGKKHYIFEIMKYHPIKLKNGEI